MAISSDEKTMPIIVYALMLASAFYGVTAIVALIIAYISKDKATGEVSSHYVFIIRTFWMALMVVVLSYLSILTIIMMPFAFLALIGLMIWTAVRMIMGLVKLINGEPISKPQTNMLP